MQTNGFVKGGEDFKRGDKVIIWRGRYEICGCLEQELEDGERILLTTISYQGRLVVSKDVLEKVG
jgi:hypothetical protein